MSGASLNGLPGAADPLAALRDWHLPEPVSWWPPAPGWWLLVGLVLLIGSLSLRAWRRWRHRTAPARLALVELQGLKAALVSGAEERPLVSALSALLRRLALARYPRVQVAGLTGPDWLDFLDRTGGAGAFTRGPGRLLAEIPYRAGPAPGPQTRPSPGGAPPSAGANYPGDLNGLLDLAGRWIRAHWRPRP